MVGEIITLLRTGSTTWFAAACLPLPALLMISSATNADVACLYLGLASAWLATQIIQSGSYPDSRTAWLTKIAAITFAVGTNAALFAVLGMLVSVRSNIPFPLLSVFAVIPSIGLLPWMTLRIGEPFKAMVLSAFILMACKLAACVVARFVYGADYIEHGYVAADWRTAKLMISLTWTSITTISAACVIHGYFRIAPQAVLTQHHASATK